MAVRSFIYIFSLILVFSSAVFSQQESPNYKTYTAKIGNSDTLVNLDDKFLIQFSEILTLQSKILIPLSDYVLDHRNGIIKLDKDLFKKYSASLVE